MLGDNISEDEGRELEQLLGVDFNVRFGAIIPLGGMLVEIAKQLNELKEKT
jgi:hypothetical protein